MYALFAGPLFQIFWKDFEFQWETEENRAMTIQKDALCNAPALRTLAVSDGTSQRVVGVDASSEGWGAILQQDDENKYCHPFDYERGL